MAQAKGGALGTALMVGAFVLIGALFYWLSITAVPAPTPAAVEAPALEASGESPAPEMDGGEAPAAGASN